MSHTSDQDLIRQALQGDKRAFGQFVRRHQQKIYRLALRMLRNETDAEDVVQETFVRAYQSLARFEGNSQPFTWLYRIAVNHSLNILRKRKTRGVSSPIDDPLIDAWVSVHSGRSSDSPADKAQHRQTVIALLEAIDELSTTLKTTLLLVIGEGLSHGQASEVLGCPEGTVAWRVHEARRKLHAALIERGFGDVEEVTP